MEKQKTLISTKRVHYDRLQTIPLVVNARKTFVTAPRGLGKTMSIMAYRQQRLAHVMPRGSFLFVGESFKKIVQDFIPKWRVGWERLGFRLHTKDEPGHFVIRTKPPDHWPKPLFQTDDYSQTITWYTGATLHLVSQDRNASSKLGIDCDAIDVDECKTLDWARYKTEISPTRRGNHIRWGHLPEYGSEWFYTDKYIGVGHSDWFLQFREKSTPDIVELILLLSNEYAKTGDPEFLKEIQLLQKNCIHFYEPEEIGNLEVLGYDFFKENYDNLTPTEFLTAIFNETIKKIEGGFYFMLDENIHGYTSNSDYNPQHPLHIGVDWGGNFNCMAVHQVGNSGNVRLIRTLHVETPRKYDYMFDELNSIYSNHKERIIYAYTGHDGSNKLANSKFTFNQDLELYFRSKKFNVVIANKGLAALTHNLKYKIWKKVLDNSKDRDVRYPKWSFNLNDGYDGYVSMAKAPVKVTRSGKSEEFKKDKSSEDPKKNSNQLIATHLSDAIDNVVCYRCKDIEKANKWS